MSDFEQESRMFVEIKHVGDGWEPVIEHADGRLESLKKMAANLEKEGFFASQKLVSPREDGIFAEPKDADIFVHVVITAREMEAKEEARRRKELADTVGVPENVVKLLGY